jgi:hypothetical protein
VLDAFEPGADVFDDRPEVGPAVVVGADDPGADDERLGRAAVDSGLARMWFVQRLGAR